MAKAVITGDIIQSSKMTNEHKVGLVREIRILLKQIDKDYKSKSELYRGDSFQCLLPHCEQALRVALIIKTAIRSMNPSELVDITKKKNLEVKTAMVLPFWLFDARIAIGIGEVEVEMKQVATSQGEAFELSGMLLDELKNTRFRLGIATNDEHREELLTEGILLDAIISKTSALQCEVIEMKLQGHTETEIAKKFKIMQSAVNQRSIGGNWNAIQRMVERFEEIYSNE